MSKHRKHKIMNEKEEIIKTEITTSVNAPLRQGGSNQMVDADQFVGDGNNLPTFTDNGQPPKDDSADAINKETITMTNMYNQLNKLFGGSQLFVMEYPTRGLNQLDYAYKIEDYNSSSLLKPYVIAENEFRLTDNLMDLSPIVQGTNGKKLSTEYQTVLNNYTPKIDDITDFITDKMELRMFLLETITDKIGDQEYTCSRMEFCQKLYLYYLEQKAQWDQEKFEKNKKAVAENTLNEYAAWLATTAWTKDKKLEALFNDAIVRGFYHEIMTILGFIDIASPAERLENAKINLRTSVRRRIDGSGEVYPVSLSPSNWFRALTPNYSPQDLLADGTYIREQYIQKHQLLMTLQNELSNLLSMQSNPEDLKALQQQVADLNKGLIDDEKQYAENYGATTIQMVKLALQFASKGNMAGFLKGEVSDIVSNELNIENMMNMAGVGKDNDTFTTIVENITSMYKHHLDYFEKYSQLAELQLAEAKLHSSSSQEMINILKERIAIVDDEVKQLGQILSSSFVNDKTQADGKETDGKETDGTETDGTETDGTETDGKQVPESLLPQSKYDDDGLFSEIIISNSESKSNSEEKNSTITANAKGGMNRFLFHASVNAQYSSSTHEFTNSISNSEVQIAMRVMKVSIERGGWFDPGIIDISQSYMRIKKDLIASNGITAKDILFKFNNTSNNESITNDGSILPGFPSAFLIAKDIHIKASNMSSTQAEFNEFKKATASGSANLFGFRLSGNFAMENTSEKTNDSEKVTSLSIKIPGPQIIGWFMQLTPKDQSHEYIKLSGSETFTKIIDSLKDYKQKMKEMRGEDEYGNLSSVCYRPLNNINNSFKNEEDKNE